MIMEYKCPICGKTYTDVDAVVKCANDCRNAAIARKNEEDRKQKASKVKEIEDQIKYHFDEWNRLSKELYKIDPSASGLGRVLKVSWPNYDFFNILGF